MAEGEPTPMDQSTEEVDAATPADASATVETTADEGDASPEPAATEGEAEEDEEKEEIKEEEEKPSPPVFILGLDFGTQCCVATWAKKGDGSRPHIVANNINNFTTPSLLSFRGKDCFIGEDALSQAVANATGTTSLIKRHLADNDATLASASAIDVKLATSIHCPYTKEDSSYHVNYIGEDRSLSSRLAVALLLRQMRDFTDAGIPRDVRATDGADAADATDFRAVLAVPNVFTLAEQEVMLDALAIANIKPLAMVSEATAVALAYNLKHPVTAVGKKDTVLFVDVGHAYTSVQLVQFTASSLCVLASRCATGGRGGARVADVALFDKLAAEIQGKYKVEVRDNKKASSRLEKEVEKVKKNLSGLALTPLNIESLTPEVDVQTKVERSTVDQAVDPVCKELTEMITACLSVSGIRVAQLAATVVVGGGVRIPALQNAVKNVVGELNKTLDSAHSVAEGAGIFGLMKSRSEHSRKFEVIDPFFKQPENLGETTDERRARLQADIDLLQTIDEQSRINKELGSLRNSVEETIFKYRGAIGDPANDKALTGEQKDAIRSGLQTFEEWLWDEADVVEDKDVLVAKLAEIETFISTAAPKLVAVLADIEAAKKKKAEEDLARVKAEAPAKPSTKQPRSNKERISWAVKRKDQGNSHFTDLDYGGAATRYDQGLQYLKDVYYDESVTSEMKSKINDLKLNLHLNSAAVFLKTGHPEEVLSHCNHVIDLDKKNVKGFFRRGQAHLAMKELALAKADLSTAKKLDSSNQSVSRLLGRVNLQIKQQKKKEKKMYGKMFG